MQPTDNYSKFLAGKRRTFVPSGITVPSDSLNPKLFEFQRDVVSWALRKGRACVFLSTGLGKTAIQLAWAQQVAEHTQRRVLIVAPLAVSGQTVAEGLKFDVKVTPVRANADVRDGINIVNYEMLEALDLSQFGGVVLDESSILKSYTSKTRNTIITAFSDTLFKLACTATPAPNDHMELGNHAEFVGVMSRTEMLSMFFIHDGSDTAKWRLKGHAETEFWRWMASWAVMLSKPSDAGYDVHGYDLPTLHVNQVTVDDAEATAALAEMKVNRRTAGVSLEAARKLRHVSIEKRVAAAAALVAQNPNEQWVVWCDLNDESEALTASIPGAIEVTGSDPNDWKERANLWFKGEICECQLRQKGPRTVRPARVPRVVAPPVDVAALSMDDLYSDTVAKPVTPKAVPARAVLPTHGSCTCGGVKPGRVLVSKPSIFGYGLNWQNCRRTVFVGLSYSFEAYYQAVRRFWRFGQTQEVHAYVVTSSAEGAIVAAIQEKERRFAQMLKGMISATQELTKENIRQTHRQEAEYEEAVEKGQGWMMLLGDSCKRLKEIPNDKMGFSIFSPPFASLYTYSNSERDLGNSASQDEFFKHFEFFVQELYRVTMPGRISAVHCMLLPTSKERDGYIGLRDFRGDIVRIFQKAGFIFHSETAIWKNPVIAMQRTKALGLLHKTIRKDSAMSRCGINDYLVAFRKPGENPKPIAHTHETFPVSMWQQFASPVWADVNPGDTLQYRSARDNNDERHICPLRLSVIQRAIFLWTNPGDVVLSPFAGIGSEGFQAISMGRKFVGVELKRSYFDAAVNNLRTREEELKVTGPDLSCPTFQVFDKREAYGRPKLAEAGTSEPEVADVDEEQEVA